MLSRKFQTLLPMLCASALVVSACGPKERIRPLYPPAADLKVEPKPIAGPEIVTSAQAAARYDVAIESWGERGWQAVARICRWASRNGMEVACPSQP